MAGVTLTGFEKKTLDEIRSEVEVALKASLGPSINLQADSLLGNLVGIFCSREAEMWELAQAVYGSSYPDSASGVPLDNVAAITGATRLPATRTVLRDVELYGTPGTVIPDGSVIVSLAGDRFRLVGGPFVIGDYPNAVFESEELGPVLPGTGHVSGQFTIGTPVAGWTDVFYDYDISDGDPTNPSIGRNVETDAAFRLRRVLLLARQGDATVSAIRSDVLAVNGVYSALVFENTSMVTDADGVPAKSIEVVVADVGPSYEQDAAIAQAIYDSKAAGIYAHGATSGQATDSFANPLLVSFSRVTNVPVDVVFNVEIIAADWPADGIVQITAQVADLMARLQIGQDVFATRLYAAAYRVAGVQNVTSVALSSAVVVGGNVVIAPREKAVLGTVTVYVSPVSPT